MEILELDRLPHVSAEDRARLKVWRNSADTRFALDLLSKVRPEAPGALEDLNPSSTGVLLGMHEGFHAAFKCLFGIGVAEPAPKSGPAADPSYGVSE